MPRRLPARCRPHTVAEFRAAALQRHADADALERAGRRTAAVYLWGYSAEMILKAAVFTAWGYPADEEIHSDDVHAARSLAPMVGLRWTGSLHNVAAWAELLVRFRASIPGLAYPDPRFGSELLARCYGLYLTWRETLRYHKNVAYPHEVRDTRAVVEWLFAHLHQL